MLLFWENELDGGFETAGLAQSIIEVCIDRTNFSGSLNLVALPRHTTHFSAFINAFSGSLDFTELLQALFHRDLTWNSFSGVADFGNLPGGLKFLSVNINKLSG